jgi:hypothetical protein
MLFTFIGVGIAVVVMLLANLLKKRTAKADRRQRPQRPDQPSSASGPHGHLLVFVPAVGRFPHARFGTVRDNTTGQPPGGEQAANTLQPAGSIRHAMTANAKVSGAIEACRWSLDDDACVHPADVRGTEHSSHRTSRR